MGVSIWWERLWVGVYDGNYKKESKIENKNIGCCYSWYIKFIVCVFDMLIKLIK